MKNPYTDSNLKKKLIPDLALKKPKFGFDLVKTAPSFPTSIFTDTYFQQVKIIKIFLMYYNFVKIVLE